LNCHCYQMLVREGKMTPTGLRTASAPSDSLSVWFLESVTKAPQLWLCPAVWEELESVVGRLTLVPALTPP
jgi:hypothetical protein